MSLPGASLRSVVAIGPGRLLRVLCGPNTRQARLEQLGLLGLAVSLLALLVWGADLPGRLRAGAWVLWLLAGALLLRRAWLWLGGPVLRHDLVRSTRRGRTFGLRCLYLVLLLIALAVLYSRWMPPGMWLSPVRGSQAARFALAFFRTFACTQLALVVLLTPALTAGAIAEEKESRTLEFVLATDLGNHEIVLGKLVSRLAHLVLLVLAGLPVLSMVQLLGGVDPNLVLGAFAVTGLTLASVAGLSILSSVLARRARDALLLAYLTIATYAILCVLDRSILSTLPGWGSFPSTKHWTGPLALRYLVAGLRCGSPPHAWLRLPHNSGSPDRILLRVLRDYALFHGLVAATCVLGAVARLRTAALREPRRPGGCRATRVWPRLRVGSWPMVWKEVWADLGWGLSWPGRLLLAGLVLASFVPIWSFAEDFILDAWYAQLKLNEWLRWVGTLVALVALLAIAVRAASSIRVERDRDTLDSLLTTPLTPQEILFGKWLGSIIGVRWLALWLAVIWGVGVLGGGLSLRAVPLLAITCLVYAAALSSLGLYFSVRCRTTRRAIALTVLATLGLSIGHWVVWLPFLPDVRRIEDLEPFRDMEELKPLVLFEAGMTPPWVLGKCLPFPDFAFNWQGSPLKRGAMTPYAQIGAVCWGFLALFLWVRARRDFNRLTGRVKLLPRTPGADGRTENAGQPQRAGVS